LNLTVEHALIKSNWAELPFVLKFQTWSFEFSSALESAAVMFDQFWLPDDPPVFVLLQYFFDLFSNTFSVVNSQFLDKLVFWVSTESTAEEFFETGQVSG